MDRTYLPFHKSKLTPCCCNQPVTAAVFNESQNQSRLRVRLPKPTKQDLASNRSEDGWALLESKRRAKLPHIRGSALHFLPYHSLQRNTSERLPYILATLGTLVLQALLVLKASVHEAATWDIRHV